ncbi:A-kinase-interacting protein 1 isoform X4 [Ambystoma mexicanum]
MINRGTWMERSLERSANLCLDVLNRAKRRQVNWPAECHVAKFRNQDSGWYDDHQGMRLQQDERFYSHKPACSCSKNEVNHVCRYHGRNALENLRRPRNPAKREPFPSFTVSPAQGSKSSKDLHIEVSPGTYSISTHSHGSEQAALMVNISPGQSVDVVFIH